jgi:hypothetical protein
LIKGKLVSFGTNCDFKTDDLLEMSFNLDKVYGTYRDEFIEREWQILKSNILLG